MHFEFMHSYLWETKDVSKNNFNISDNEDSLWIRKYLDSKETQYVGNLYEKYKQKIYVHCMKLVMNSEVAKDITSESFIKAFNHIESFKLEKSFYPWLSRIALNLCVDHLRKKSRYKFQQLEEKHAVINYEHNDQNESQEYLKHKILKAVKMLKPLQRRCFCLFYIHRLSYKEIVEMTGYPSDQVRSHIQNGRRRFKILME